MPQPFRWAPRWVWIVFAVLGTLVVVRDCQAQRCMCSEHR